MTQAPLFANIAELSALNVFTFLSNRCTVLCYIVSHNWQRFSVITGSQLFVVLFMISRCRAPAKVGRTEMYCAVLT